MQLHCFAYDSQIKYISTTFSSYAKMAGSVFGPLTLASSLSRLFPSLCPLFYSVSVLYSAAELMNQNS